MCSRLRNVLPLHCLVPWIKHMPYSQLLKMTVSNQILNQIMHFSTACYLNSYHHDMHWARFSRGLQPPTTGANVALFIVLLVILVKIQSGTTQEYKSNGRSMPNHAQWNCFEKQMDVSYIVCPYMYQFALYSSQLIWARCFRVVFKYISW